MCSEQHHSQQSKSGNNTSVHQWMMNSMWCMHMMEYHSALKKEILTHAMTRMDPEDILLREMSQTQEGEYHMISRIRGSQSR